MIAIINIDENVRKTGPHKYAIKINQRIVTEFVHEREKPLHDFLLAAAIAAEEKATPKNGRIRPLLEPLYDDIYYEGMKYLDSL